ncbi:MAG: hypothetical protein ACREAY_03165 [Nitrososphaera sp.]|uniref:hypothetical protein n=1 Tax=Nitrososphaera sp. TaxID=1971748 RepID=UPI003D6FC381
MKTILIASIGAAVAVAIGLVIAFSLTSSNNSGADDSVKEDQPGSSASAPMIGGDGTNTPPQGGQQPEPNEEEPRSTENGGSSTSATGTFVAYQFYREPSEGAFTMLIPAGWQAQAFVNRPLGIPAVAMTAASPDATQGIAIEMPRGIRYVTPVSGPEGSWYQQGATINLTYRTADQYVQEIYIPELQEKLSSDIQLMNSGKIPESIPQTATAGSAGEYLFSYTTKEGQSNRLYVGLQTAGYPGPSGDIATWEVTLIAVAGPEDKFTDVIRVALNSILTFRADERWVLAEIERMGGQATDMARSNDEIREKSSAMFSEYIRGTHEERDPATGETITVPSIDNYYWKEKNTGEIIGTPTNDSPDPGREFILLERSG